MYPRQIQRLIQLFSGFPTVGQRTATRFVFYLLRAPRSEVKELIEAIAQVRNQIALCKLCFQPFDASEKTQELCIICNDNTRSKEILCVIEKESDLEALESIKEYKGLYFILGGPVDPLKKEQREILRMKELEERLKDSPIKEVIIATNPTVEGEATALYLERVFKDSGIKLTRLGRGLPIGGELEYADPETLKQSLENRR
ncbi:MAG: recombination mediator RecR [bacterium]|nr:recombination mediator RecR [bacterium]